MSDVNLYFYIESLNLTAGQINTLIDQLQHLGQRNQDGNPRMRNHWRIRPDNKAVIFEAVWDDADLTAINVRNRLASIFGVAQASITYSTNSTAYGPLVTFTYGGVDRLRMGVFGGVNATYQDSQNQARHFLSDFAAKWEVEQ